MPYVQELSGEQQPCGRRATRITGLTPARRVCYAGVQASGPLINPGSVPLRGLIILNSYSSRPCLMMVMTIMRPVGKNTATPVGQMDEECP